MEIYCDEKLFHQLRISLKMVLTGEGWKSDIEEFKGVIIKLIKK